MHVQCILHIHIKLLLCMYVFTHLTIDMVIDLVDHVPDVYLSLYSELTAVHVVGILVYT